MNGNLESKIFNFCAKFFETASYGVPEKNFPGCLDLENSNSQSFSPTINRGALEA